jgi:hypothetical protein
VETYIECPLKWGYQTDMTKECSKNACAWWMWTDKANEMGGCAIAIVASQLAMMAARISRG